MNFVQLAPQRDEALVAGSAVAALQMAVTVAKMAANAVLLWYAKCCDNEEIASQLTYSPLMMNHQEQSFLVEEPLVVQHEQSQQPPPVLRIISAATRSSTPNDHQSDMELVVMPSKLERELEEAEDNDDDVVL